MLEDKELAAFQAALLELLVSNLDPNEILQEIKAGPAFIPFRKYVENFEPRYIEWVALALRKCALRGDNKKVSY